MQVRVWTQTHNGAVRKHNEDALVSRPDIGLWAVADGAGGHAAGEVASGMLAEALNALPADMSGVDLLSALRSQVSEVHAQLRAEADRRGSGTMIASTIVILVMQSGHFACLWAGDSRGYLLRDGILQQITRDHSLVQELVESNLITAEQAETHPQASVITRAVGSDDALLELDKVSGKLEPGDRFLLCSDGLCKTLPERELASLLGSDTELGAAMELIKAALAHEARDNITAVVVEVPGGGEAVA